MHRWLIMVGMVGLLPALVWAQAPECTALWTYPAPPADLAGFRIYAGAQSGGPYALRAEAPPAARSLPIACTVGEYMVLRAVDSTGTESPSSTEVLIVEVTAPPVPGQFSVMMETVEIQQTTIRRRTETTP